MNISLKKLFLFSRKRKSNNLYFMNFSSNPVISQNVVNPKQAKLIASLKKEGMLYSKEVEDVMASIDRGDFAKFSKYENHASLIGHGATISAPNIHSLALEIIKNHLKKGTRALDIGCGSGYLLVAFAKLMQESDAKVYGVEHIPELVNMSIENISKHYKHYLDNGKINVILGDGREGLPNHAPFDVIHVGAAAEDVPKNLQEQLANGGRMIIPIGKAGFQRLTVIDKDKDGNIKKRKTLPVGFVPLTSKEKQVSNEDYWSLIFNSLDEDS